MCGIVGIVSADAPSFRERLEHSVDVLAHRGPDDRAVVEWPGAILGHRRLAIIDLSSAGRQPMIDPVSGDAIVYNGEIYNYVELGRELESTGHRFRTKTDTEVLLAAIREWGPRALERLNGMWAFAHWNPAEGRLLLARDRFGVKPLYYSRRAGLSFASEPKALLALHPELGEPDTQVLYDFFAHGELYGRGRAFYEGVSILPPAHAAEYSLDSGTLRTWSFWHYPEQGSEDPSPEEAVERFSTLFDDAVALRLRSDVAVGVSLSGGLDSSAVLAAAVRGGESSPVLFTSTYGASGEGEAPWARRAADHFDLVPHLVPAMRDEWLDTMMQIAWHMDAPGYSPAVYPLWFLMREARAMDVPVLLEGQGADEVLAGYPHYAAVQLLEGLRGGPGGRWQHLIRYARTFPLNQLFGFILREWSPWIRDRYRKTRGSLVVLAAEVRQVGLEAVRDTRPLLGNRGRDAVGRRLMGDHARDILPGLLHYGDAISMAHSVESRQPFLDYRLVEWLFSISSSPKLHEGQTKWPVREYLRRRGLPQIGNRPDKLGYLTPVENWLVENDGALARDILLGPDGRLRDYCDERSLARWLGRATRGGGWFASRNHVYRLVSAELWLRAQALRLYPVPGDPASARA